MSSWQARVEPSPCRALAWQLAAAHLAVAAAPWAAGCGPVLALVLTAVSLLALPATLSAIPGSRCPIRALRLAGGEWSASLRHGAEATAQVNAATRVFPAIVVCRLEVGGRRLDWWIPRYALPADEFRRLKVALRCVRHGAPALAC